MFKTNLHILEVRDNEDGYIYCTLIFDTEERLNEAKQAIAEFDLDWYTSNNGNDYYHDLIKMLESKDLFEYDAHIQSIYIR